MALVRTGSTGPDSDTHAPDLTERMMYGAQGLVVAYVDGRGLTATHTHYDLQGEALVDIHVDSGESLRLIDSRGLTRLSWDARGIEQQQTHDALGRPTERRYTRPGGSSRLDTTWRYDSLDSPPSDGSTAASRMLIGQLTEQKDSAGLERVTVRDPLARSQQFATIWDRELDLDSGAPAASAWALETESFASRTVTNALGEPTLEELPDGITRRPVLGLRGELRGLTIEAADGTITERPVADAITYSARGERTSWRLGNDVTREATYDARTGRLMRSRAIRPAGSSPAGDLMDLRYVYDPAGNVVQMHDLQQDPSATGGPYSGGSLLTVSAARGYAYDAHHRLRRATGRLHQALVPRSGLPQFGIFTPRSLNDAGALVRYTRRYGYDDGGNLSSIAQQVPSAPGASWTLNKWVSATSNRQTERDDDSGIAHPNPEAFFDAAGHRTEMSHLRAMDWTDAGRLGRAVRIERAGGTDDAEYYVYGGGEGLRQRKVTQRVTDVANGTTEEVETRTFRGPLGHCELRVIVRGGTETLSRWTSHLSAGETKIATLHRWTKDDDGLEVDDVTDMRLLYPLSDHLGSVAIELNDAAEVVSLEEYFVYGGTAFLYGDSAREVNLREYRYAGKLRDSFTGFYAYDYRELIPWLGNWLSPDPAGDVDGPNRFAFVGGNPVRMQDVSGLFQEDATEPDLGKYSQYLPSASGSDSGDVTVIPRTDGSSTLIANPGPEQPSQIETFTEGDTIVGRRSADDVSAIDAQGALPLDVGSDQVPEAADDAASAHASTPSPSEETSSPSVESRETPSTRSEVERVRDWLQSLSESLSPELTASYGRREYEDLLDEDRTRRQIDRGESPDPMTEANPGSRVQAIDPLRQRDLAPLGALPSRSLLVGIEDETRQESRVARISPEDVEALRQQRAAAERQHGEDLVIGPHGGPDGRGGVTTREAYEQNEYDANTEMHLRAMQASTSFTGTIGGAIAALAGGDIEDIAGGAEMGMALDLIGLSMAGIPSARANVLRGVSPEAFAARSTGVRFRITFGENSNQREHAFRHTDKSGIPRQQVTEAVLRDLIPFRAEVSPGHNPLRSVRINGIEVQYRPFMRDNGTINVGRIHGPRN